MSKTDDKNKLENLLKIKERIIFFAYSFIIEL